MREGLFDDTGWYGCDEEPPCTEKKCKWQKLTLRADGTYEFECAKRDLCQFEEDEGSEQTVGY